MRCARVRDKLDAYITESLAPQVRGDVAEHLETCKGCQAALERLLRLSSLLKESHVPAVPDGLAGRIVAAAKPEAFEQRSPAARPRWRISFSIPMGVAAAAVLVAGVVMGALVARSAYSPVSVAVANQAAVADPVAVYNLDYLSEAPDGSLAQAYLALVSDKDASGR